MSLGISLSSPKTLCLTCQLTACGATVSSAGAPCSCASSSRLPPQRTRVTRAVVRDTEARLRAFDAACADVREAGNVDELITEPATELSVEVELAPPEEQ